MNGVDLVEYNPAKGQPLEIFDRRDPMPIARRLIETRFKADGHPTLHHHQGAFYRWSGTHYEIAEESSIREVVWKLLEGALRPAKRGAADAPFQPTSSVVGNVMDAVKAITHLPAKITPPHWLEPGNDIAPEQILACSNGLLWLPARALLTHSPTFFNQSALDYAFDQYAPDPKTWEAFLESLWPDDREAINTLQEIFGVLLTNNTAYQKIFLICGPKRSGKGTIARVLRRLLGADNVVSPTLAALGQQFGLAPLIGKPLAVIADARLGSRADQHAIAERLLSVSGEDAQQVDRKFLPAWNGPLPTRFLILTNELPRLADASGALASRFLVLTLQESFYGREDQGLTDRLLAELPGILNWSIEGWERLKARGYFIQPKSSADAIEQLEDLGSPISAFVRDCMDVGPGYTVACDALYVAWTGWCQRNGRDHPGTAQTFGRDMNAALPGIKITQPRNSGKRSRWYEGAGLKDVT